MSAPTPQELADDYSLTELVAALNSGHARAAVPDAIRLKLDRPSPWRPLT